MKLIYEIGALAILILLCCSAITLIVYIFAAIGSVFLYLIKADLVTTLIIVVGTFLAVVLWIALLNE